jgi:hypothetical protein
MSAARNPVPNTRIIRTTRLFRTVLNIPLRRERERRSVAAIKSNGKTCLDETDSTDID